MANKFTPPTTYPHKCLSFDGYDVVIYEVIDGQYFGRYLDDGQWYPADFYEQDLRDSPTPPRRAIKLLNITVGTGQIVIYRFGYDAETGDNPTIRREDV